MTKDLSIENLCGGAVQERINRALRKVSDCKNSLSGQGAKFHGLTGNPQFQICPVFRQDPPGDRQVTSFGLSEPWA